jgi:CRP/FNR family transcriptional regulator, anaerobic regulatory protein
MTFSHAALDSAAVCHHPRRGNLPRRVGIPNVAGPKGAPMPRSATSAPVAGRCGECPIRYRAVCSQCESGELETLERIKDYRTFQPGEHVAHAGQPMPVVGSVVQGVAQISSTLIDGRRQMVGLLFPSDFVGRPGRRTTPYDVVAVTPLTLCVFQKPAFEKLIAESPRIERRLLEMTFDELEAAREWMLLLGRKSAREKIASLFTIMGRRHAALLQAVPKDGLSFPLYITREAMADYLGLTFETVSRQISALKRDGVIRLEGTREVHVPNFMRLIEESGDDADGGLPD